MSENKCKNCRFSARDKYYEEQLAENNAYQCDCPKFKYGYSFWIKDVEKDCVVIENDEGWGLFVGGDFRCKHFEHRESKNETNKRAMD